MAQVISTHFFKGSMNGKSVSAAFPEAHIIGDVDGSAIISAVSWYSDKLGRYAYIIASGIPYYYRPNINQITDKQTPC